MRNNCLHMTQPSKVKTEFNSNRQAFSEATRKRARTITARPNSAFGIGVLLLLVMFKCQCPAFTLGGAFTYQGRLTDGVGSANGTYDLLFTIYDSTNLPGGVVAGPVTNSAVGITNGLFTVKVDFGSDVFDGFNRWLEIGVRSNGNGPL